MKSKRTYTKSKEHAEDMSYENESSTVTITLREYDSLRQKAQATENVISDPDLINVIDKLEELVRVLRRRIVRPAVAKNFVPFDN
tara:strand:+ start:893 stop:1147 length:255 start_codon:yes stop_codon:yes gene_type:complete